jgi:flagellar basal body rod protein FlgC
LTDIAGGAGADALQHEGYTGPTGEELAAQNRYGLGKVEDANRALQQTATEGGVAGAFRNQYGGRALTLAERSALGQGGNLTQSLADTRKTSQAGLESLAGKDYTGQVQSTQEANAATKKAIRDRVNVLSGNLATEVADSAAAQGAETDATRVAALTQTAAGSGPEFEAAAQAISDQLISQGYDPMSTAFRTAAAAALAKVREAATAQLGRFESGANKTQISGQSALEGNEDYQKRMDALTALSGMTEGVNLGNYSTESSTYDPWSTAAQQQGYADTGVAAYLEAKKARDAQRAFEAAARSGTTDASGVVRDPLAEASVASPIDAAVSSTTAATNAATEPARAIDKEVRDRLGLP